MYHQIMNNTTIIMRVPLQWVSNELLLEPLYIAITVNIF